jgi:hypothetical protein
MVENGYLGVACEPNCVFQICNQPAILGFRLHDLITGGNRADEVVAGYERAWAEFGRLDPAGHYNMMVAEDSRAVRPNERPSPWVAAWCGALMNMWNREFVHANYPRQVKDFLVAGPHGTLGAAHQAAPPARTTRRGNRHDLQGRRTRPLDGECRRPAGGARRWRARRAGT